MPKGSEFVAVAKKSFRDWSDDGAPRMGAALSYYTVFSLAPLLVVVIAVAGLFFGDAATRGQIFEQVQGVLGPDAAALIQSMIQKAGESRSGVVASIVGVATLLLGATGVLMELRAALNTIWKVRPRTGRKWTTLLRERLLSFGVILAFGFILIVSLALSAVLSAMGSKLDDIVPGWVVLGYVLNYGVSFLVVALFAATLFKLLPEAKVAWQDVWIGSLVTSALFHVGKWLIGLYLGKASVGSPFGAAGSLAVLLVWIYYSSQIFLLGAEFTHAYAERPHRQPERRRLPLATRPDPSVA
jgi:membrane protein